MRIEGSRDTDVPGQPIGRIFIHHRCGRRLLTVRAASTAPRSLWRAEKNNPNNYIVTVVAYATEDQSKMAKLTTRSRKKVPAKEFGEPKKRAYPMPDKTHAANAKARAAQMVKKGKLSESEKKKIDAKANKKLSTKSK
jgi:hypothetical protein